MHRDYVAYCVVIAFSSVYENRFNFELIIPVIVIYNVLNIDDTVYTVIIVLEYSDPYDTRKRN
jgi:hypothetical protein